MPLSHYCYIKSKLNHHQPLPPTSMHCNTLLCTATPQHKFQITYMMTFSTLILQWWLLSPTFPIHWFCCIARIITLLSYDECAASPLHRNTPIQHITSCISSIHVILLFLKSRGCHGLPHRFRYVPPMLLLFVSRVWIVRIDDSTKEHSTASMTEDIHITSPLKASLQL